MGVRYPLTVAKLGGSYAFSNELPQWLAAIAGGAGDVVLVPGGGPFADAVRAAQPKMKFNDAAAHHMALLAMEQYGRALVALNATLALADSIAAIRGALRARKVPVWSPTRMVLAAKDIPGSWDVTSDSLAAWLARRLGAQRLLLIKHVDPASGSIRIEDLIAGGIVDRSSAAFLAASPLEASIVGPAQLATAADDLKRRDMPGTRIVLR
jgi:5-(aminomethyl)-3-furanmethanol phosphate kinase